MGFFYFWGMLFVMKYDVIIIGAGAAGLMCAIEAGKRGRSVLVLDKAKKAAGKILISGGGRCNFTNLYIEPEAYLSHNPHFCKSALSRYTQWDFISLFEKHQLTWEEKTQGQLFCQQKSKGVVDMLLAECQQHQVKLQLQTEIQDCSKNEHSFRVSTNTNHYHAVSLVIATGGPSIPRMGSSDFGVRVAKQFGLKSIPFRAGLVPFTFSQPDIDTYFKDLAGLAFDTNVRCNGKSFREHSLITHRGLSGPAMLQISSYWNKGDTLDIDLLPDMDAANWLQEQQQNHPDKHLLTVLTDVLPKRLAQRLTETLLSNKPMKQYHQTALQQIAQQLTHWQLTPAGTEGMRTAEVAIGGVDTDELSSKTMEAKKVAGLYFIGETVDVTGWLGGYNFQWAWSSGWCAGQFV
jgi:predicted Rossmann fold flavoprotein